MSEPANRSDLHALSLTLATLLCVTALADVSAATVLVPVQRDGVTLSEQRRMLAERIVQQFQQWQAAQAAIAPAASCDLIPSSDAPTILRSSAPLVISTPAPPVRPHLLNLPPPGATL